MGTYNMYRVRERMIKTTGIIMLIILVDDEEVVVVPFPLGEYLAMNIRGDGVTY